MEQLSLMAQLQLTLVIYLLVGVFLRKRGIMPKEAAPYFTDFLLMVCLPAMIFSSFNIALDGVNARVVSAIVLIGFAYMFASFGLSKVIYRHIPDGRRKVMQYGTIVSNAGFLGLPIAYQIYGPLGLFYSSFFLIPLRVFIFSAGISLFFDSDIKTKIKSMLLHPAMIATYFGGMRMLFQVQIPAPIDTALVAIGRCTTPMAMIIIGMILADVPVKNSINRDVLLASFMRLIALPGILLAVMKLLGADPVMSGVMVIHIAMPMGMTTAALAQKYGGDYVFALRCVLVSTVLSLGTVPLLILLV